MVNRESAERAVKDANPIIDGRKANVNLAYLGAKPRNGFLQNGKNLAFSFFFWNDYSSTFNILVNIYSYYSCRLATGAIHENLTTESLLLINFR